VAAAASTPIVAPLPAGLPMAAPLPAGLAVRRGSLGRAPPLPEAPVAAAAVGKRTPPALGLPNLSALGSPRVPGSPSSLPVIGSRYVVVRKGQQFRAEANPKSKKMGKMRLGEELEVQDVQMLEGGLLRVLCVRPVQMSANATQPAFMAAGWCSISLKGRTQLAPVGAGCVEEVEVYDDDGEDEEDDGELSVGLTIEGEHGFGLDIGEAAVAGPEAEDGLEGAEAATMVQTVVTNVDVGCQAEGLGVKIGMVLIRIGGEDITQCGPEEAVERVYGICDEQGALGVGVPGGDPLEWVFKITDRPNSNGNGNAAGQSGTPRTKLMLRQYEVIKECNIRPKIQVKGKVLGRLHIGQVVVAMAVSECDGHQRIQIATDPEQWVSSTIPDGKSR